MFAYTDWHTFLFIYLQFWRAILLCPSTGKKVYLKNANCTRPGKLIYTLSLQALNYNFWLFFLMCIYNCALQVGKMPKKWINKNVFVQFLALQNIRVAFLQSLGFLLQSWRRKYRKKLFVEWAFAFEIRMSFRCE